MLEPPPFRPTMSLSHKFRFTNGANAGTYAISRKNVLNLLLTATSAVTTVRTFSAARLKYVEVWSNPTALGTAPPAVAIEWFGENSPSTVISDTSMGVRPAHVRAKPPPNSSNKWWSMSGFSETDTLFELSLSANCVIDVVMDVRLVEMESPVAGDIPAGAGLGQVYGDYLDGIASGSLAPVGFTVLP
jgi:hypothetical protein